MMEAIAGAIEELGRLAGLPGDAVIINGLRHCRTCGEPLQKRITWAGRDMVVGCVCDCIMKEREEEQKREEERERQRRVDRVRNLSMMPGKYSKATFGAYEGRAENAKAYATARKYAENFREMEKMNQGLLFYGPVGTGKSFTSACIANYLMEMEVPVIMTSVVRILDAEPSEQAEIRTAIRNARLLIIDDLGAERETDYALERVYGVIDDRVRANAPLIVTTNIGVKEMVTCTDIRKKRIYDRILEVCFPVEVTGKSVRLGKAAERQAQMKRYFGGGD